MERKETKGYCATVDKNELVIYMMFYGLHPWTYVNYRPEELLEIMRKTQAKLNK